METNKPNLESQPEQIDFRQEAEEQVAPDLNKGEIFSPLYNIEENEKVAEGIKSASQINSAPAVAAPGETEDNLPNNQAETASALPDIEVKKEKDGRLDASSVEEIVGKRD